MQHIKQTILTLVALIAVTTGAWAETGENIFQYCYDCQRSPAYPKTTASASLSGFANPLVGYKGSGFSVDNTSAGPWKLEYMGIWSTTDKHGIDDYSVSNYQSTYNCTDVPVFRLYQWNATANEYQHAAYGVVCAYAKVSNAVEHTALFVAQGGWGCVLTNSSHSSSMNITFDEDLSTGLTTLIAAATPNASSGTAFDLTWDATAKTATIAAMPAGNVIVEPEYFAVAEFTDGGAPTGIADIKATTDDDIVKAGTVKNIGSGTTPQGTVMYYAVQSATAPTAPDYDATGWTDKVPTATDFAEGNVYVWYYIKGAEPASVADRTDANTCSDSEITALGTTGYVTLLAAPTYAVSLNKDGLTEAETMKWKAKSTNSPEVELGSTDLKGVTKAETVTVTYTGSKKVLGVKAEKKAKVLTITVAKGSTDLSGDKLLYYTPGETYRQAIANHPENKLDGSLGWNIWESGNDATIFYTESADKARDLSIDGDQHFRPTDSINLDTVIDPTLNFYFVAQF